MLNLLREQTPFTAIGAELRDLEPCGFQHICDLCGSTSALKTFLGFRFYLSLQMVGLSPVVEVDERNAQLLRDLGQALAVQIIHPPSHMSLYSLVLSVIAHVLNA